MVLSCFIVGCKKNKARDPGISFHKIPAIIKETNKKYARPGGLYTFQQKIELSRKRREQWIRATKRGPLSESQLRNATICSNHFISGRPADLTDENNPDWIPSQNLSYAVGTLKRPSALKRHKRRTKKVEIAESPNTDSRPEDFLIEEMKIEIEEIKIEVEEETGTATQTDLLGTDLDRLREELILAKEEIKQLKKLQQNSDFSEESFLNNDRKTLYFKGIRIPDLPRVICTPHVRAVISSNSD